MFFFFSSFFPFFLLSQQGISSVPYCDRRLRRLESCIASAMMRIRAVAIMRNRWQSVVFYLLKRSLEIMFAYFLPLFPPNRWSLEDDTTLYDGFRANVPLETLCVTLKRGYQGVKARLGHLNNPKHKAYLRFFGAGEGDLQCFIIVCYISPL